MSTSLPPPPPGSARPPLPGDPDAPFDRGRLDRPAGYEPLAGRERMARRALTVLAGFAVLVIVSDLFEIELLNRIQSGDIPPSSELSSNDTRQGAAGLIQLGLYIAAAVFWIRWFHCAYANLDALGRTRRHGTGWAIGGWFVPILCLWRPKQIANDLWDHDTGGSEWLHGWWAVWLIGTWLGTIVGRMYLNGNTVSDLIAADYVDIASSVFDIAGVVLAIGVARRITRRQEQLAGA